MSVNNDERFVGPNSVMSRSGIHQRINPFFVGVTGGSGAGKTTFSRKLAKTLSSGRTVTMIDLESYCKNPNFIPLSQRKDVNFDEPESFDLVALHNDLCGLKQTRPSVQPSYGIRSGTRYSEGSVSIHAEITIAEGSMLFVDEEIGELFDLTIFIDTPPDIRLRRRLERDVRERGLSLADAVDHYMAVVLPIHDGLIEPTRQLGDLVIPGWKATDASVNDVVSLITRRIRSEEALARSYSVH